MYNHIKKIFILLSFKNKTDIFFLSILTILRAGLEVLSIGLIIPILSIVIDPENFINTYSSNFNFIKDLSRNNIFFFSDRIIYHYIFF